MQSFPPFAHYMRKKNYICDIKIIRCMKRISTAWMMACLLSGLMVLAGCSSSDDDTLQIGDEDWNEQGLVLTRDASKQNAGTTVSYFERSGIKLRVLDITERFIQAKYWDEVVPVKHVRMENLSEAIQTICQMHGSSSLTKVFRLKYKGTTYYDIGSLFSNALVNLYDESGERASLGDVTIEQILAEAKNVCCILVLDVEIVKSAENAPNYLVGIWQNDWEHLVHDHGQTATVALYPELPFSITEVMNFREDGTGYLRTIKAYKNGGQEIALDPFRYELTDYHGGDEYGYHGYYYKCYFEAGDVIEYMGRSYDNMQTLISLLCLVNYPWFKQTADNYESFTVNAGQKYGTPARDSESRIVGRWSGERYSDLLMTTIYSTWVFRSDNTGYILLGDRFNEPFAYTVSYHGSEADLTIYKYNTGFVVDDGFAKNFADTTFDPTILPKGNTMKAKFNGDQLELEGWASNYQRIE